LLFALFGETVSKPRILVLTSTFPRWNRDVEPPFVLELSQRMAEWFDVRVLAPHAAGSLFHEVMNRVLVHRFRYAPTKWQRLTYDGGILANLRKSMLALGLVPLFFIAQLLAVVRLLRRYPIDVIHAHWLLPQGLTAFLARALSGHSSKILCTSHGGDFYALKGSIFKAVKKWIADASDHLTVVSNTMREEFLKLGVKPAKISVVPMGVDLRLRFVPSGVEPSAVSIFFVGRIVEKKGLKYLIEAMPMVLKKCPQARLTVIGDGPRRRDLEKLAEDLGLCEHIRFLGAVENEELPAFYQQAAIVVFPSVVGADGDREGFGLVLAEALGCGCAVVTTDQPAMMDVVQNKKTGLVVPQKNPRELSIAIVRLLSDVEFRSALAAEGRNHVLKCFDWQVIAERYKLIIQKLANDSRPISGRQ
jgi:glycosyltransferase involved in cell wall biosynthesis